MQNLAEEIAANIASQCYYPGEGSMFDVKSCASMLMALPALPCMRPAAEAFEGAALGWNGSRFAIVEGVASHPSDHPEHNAPPTWRDEDGLAFSLIGWWPLPSLKEA